MASAHATIVVGHSDKVVNSFAVVLVDNVGSHVQICDGKVDMRIQFVSPVAVVAESLQTDHQSGRQHPQVDLFGGLLMFLTSWTVPAKQKCYNIKDKLGALGLPCVVFSELFFGRVQFEAFFQLDDLLLLTGFGMVRLILSKLFGLLFVVKEFFGFGMPIQGYVAHSCKGKT